MTAPEPLTLADYQRAAQRTDRLRPSATDTDEMRVAPLLGLAGEVGTLLSGYKKYLRDGTAYELFDENIAEELGDILWYLANTAQKWNLSLDDIARTNLTKINDRWGESARRRRPTDHFDHGLPRREQLPRTFEVVIQPANRDDKPEPMVRVSWQGRQIGNDLGDNSYDDTGYRFHDVFHLAHAAVLGWSPVARAKIFGCKRASDPVVDAVEDGGRAIVIEESIAAFMFAYARQHNHLDGVNRLDYHALTTFRTFTHDLEVRHRPLWQVEQAVLQGFAAWRQLRHHNGGIITGDLAQQTLTFRRLTPTAPAASGMARPPRVRTPKRAATSTGSINNRRSDHGKGK